MVSISSGRCRATEGDAMQPQSSSHPTDVSSSPMMAPTIVRDPILRGAGLSAGYGSLAAIRDVTVDVHRGEIVALLGATGAGKTTTLLALVGECTVFSGEVTWHGTSIDGWPLHRRAREGIGFVSEERSVFMRLSVLDNLKLGKGEVDD